MSVTGAAGGAFHVVCPTSYSYLLRSVRKSPRRNQQKRRGSFTTATHWLLERPGRRCMFGGKSLNPTGTDIRA